jgi:hypothetical protein
MSVPLPETFKTVAWLEERLRNRRGLYGICARSLIGMASKEQLTNLLPTGTVDDVGFREDRVLVVYHARTCPYSQSMMPILSKVAAVDGIWVVPIRLALYFGEWEEEEGEYDAWPKDPMPVHYVPSIYKIATRTNKKSGSASWVRVCVYPGKRVAEDILAWTLAERSAPLANTSRKRENWQKVLEL